MHNEGHMQITVWRGKKKKPLEGAVGENAQGGTLENWFKTTMDVLKKMYGMCKKEGQVESHCSHVETLGSLLGTVYNLSFLLLGLNILVYLRTNSEKQCKGYMLTIERMKETV